MTCQRAKLYNVNAYFYSRSLNPKQLKSSNENLLKFKTLGFDLPSYDRLDGFLNTKNWSNLSVLSAVHKFIESIGCSGYTVAICLEP